MSKHVTAKIFIVSFLIVFFDFKVVHGSLLRRDFENVLGGFLEHNLLTKQNVQDVHDALENRLSTGFVGEGESRLVGVLNQVSNVIFGQHLHPTLNHKSFFYARELSQQHFFNDGNKRTAAQSVSLFLKQNQINVTDPNALLNLIGQLLDEKIDRNGFFNALSGITNPPLSVPVEESDSED